MSIHIINANFNDAICWTHTPCADYTTKNAYKTFLHDDQATSLNQNKVITNQSVMLNQVWKKVVAPRVKTFAWRLIRRANPSGIRASQFSKKIIKESCRCEQTETDSHIFFHNIFARSSWLSFGLKTDALNPNLYPSSIIQLILSSLTLI